MPFPARGASLVLYIVYSRRSLFFVYQIHPHTTPSFYTQVPCLIKTSRLVGLMSLVNALANPRVGTWVGIIKAANVCLPMKALCQSLVFPCMIQGKRAAKRKVGMIVTVIVRLWPWSNEWKPDFHFVRGQDGTGIIFVKGTKQHFDEGV
jgi:hypothetical protein